MQRADKSERYLPLGPFALAMVLLALEVGCVKPGAEIQRLAPDQPIRAEARVDRAVAAVGDRIVLTVQAVARQGVEVTLPADAQISDGLDVKDVQNPEPKKLGTDQILYRREWAFCPEKVGAFILPSLEVHYRQGKGSEEKLKTPSVYVDVRSVLEADDLEGDIRDIKGPVALPSSFWIWVGVVTGAVALGLAAYGVYRYRRRRASAVPPLSPHEWALLELERLAGSGLLEAGKYKEFTLELSGIFREYVQRRFAIMAPERTTEEFVLLLRGRGEFDAVQRELVGKFLAFCDMVKFAKYAPTQAEMSQGVGIVRNFVDQTRPAPAPEKGDSKTAKVA